MPEFIVDNQIIHYEIRGIEETKLKTPLLMLHGNGEDMHLFDAIVPHIEDTKHIVLMDSRCHGESHPAEGGSIHLSYSVMADDAIALMDSLGYREYDIVGYSDGAIIALIMARKTYAVRKIIAIGVNANPDGLTPAAIRHIKADYRKAKRKKDERNMELARLMLEEPNITLADLSRIVAEVTILLGKKDPFIDRKHSEAIADALPHCSHMLIDGAGHGIPTTHPRAVIDCIRTLL